MKIGEILRMCRERKGWSQEELGYRLGYDRSLISRIETGDCKPVTYEIVKKWARICECEDLVSLDLAGDKNGSMKLRQLESVVSKMRELVSFMKIIKPERK